MSRRRPEPITTLAAIAYATAALLFAYGVLLACTQDPAPSQPPNGKAPAAPTERATSAVRADRGSPRAPTPAPAAPQGRGTRSHSPTVEEVVVSSPSPTPLGKTASAVGGLDASVQATLACIRAHESDTAGGYTAVNPTSGAAGAYQLMPEWSDDWAIRFGYPSWAPYTADQWPPTVQDHVAAGLLGEQGTAPWAGSGC